MYIWFVMYICTYNVYHFAISKTENLNKLYFNNIVLISVRQILHVVSHLQWQLHLEYFSIFLQRPQWRVQLDEIHSIATIFQGTINFKTSILKVNVRNAYPKIAD